MTDKSASDDELNCSRTVKRVVSVAGIIGLGGGWLWTGQGNLTVAAVLVTAALGLLVGRAELDGLTNLSGRAHRAAGRAHEATLTAARNRPDMRTVRAVALAALVVLSVVGMQVAPVILPTNQGTASAAAGDVDWTVNTNGTIEEATTVVEGHIYHTTSNGDIVKRDTTDGSKVWSRNIGAQRNPLVVDGTVYVGTSSSEVYALGTTNGDTEWSRSITGPGMLTYYDGNVIFRTGSTPSVLALDKDTGNTAWKYEYAQESGPVLINDGQGFGYNDPSRSFDPKTGDHKWNGTETGDYTYYYGHGVGKNAHFQGNGDGVITAYDADTGNIMWRDDFGIYGVGGDMTHHNGITFAPTSNGEVLAFNDSGGLKWRYDSNTGSGINYPPTVADGKLYVGIYGGSLRAVDRDTGSLIWQTTLDESPRTSPIVADGTAYVGTKANTLYAIDTGDSGAYSEDTMKTDLVYGHHGPAADFGEPISGTVTDADGNPVQGASVEAVNTSTGATGDSGTTDSSGAVELSVDPGEYNVTANGGTNYTAETKAVSVPEGGTSAEFSVRRAGEFGVYRNSDGKPLDTDRPVTMEAYKASEYPEWYEEPAGFWDDKSPAYRTSGSTLQFQNLPDLDSEYIIRFVPDNRDKNTVYETDRVYWSNLSMVASMGLYADTETVRASVGIKDRTENQSWAPNSVALEARNLQSDNITDTTGLSSNSGLGELSIPPNKTSRIVAVRDDGTERHLGQVSNPVAATSEPVVFVIDDPWAADADPRNQSAYDNTVALIDASPSGPTVGETVTLSAEASTAAGANNEIDTVEWSLPDGTSPTGTEVTWTPESGDGDATHPISATVTDTNGNSDTTQVQLYVATEGAPGSGQPTAYAEVVTDEPKAGDAVRIEDRSEPPANGEIDRVEWDTTGDGTYDDGQGPFVETTYDEPGVQQVSVRTVAQSGATDVYTSTIYVAAGNESQLNQPPVAEVVVDPRDPVVGDTVSFDASNSVGIGSATIASYEWKLPDGTTATGQTASYSPSEAGAGVVELTVTDSNGREASAQGSVYVAQNASARAVPPRADFAVQTDTPKVGKPVSLEATPELDDTASIESVTWDFDGDGDFTDADGESVEFTPEEAGITEVGVQVTDSNGAESQFYEYFFVTGSASQLSVGGGGGGGGAFGGGGDLGGEGPGGLPGGAPAVLGGTATLGLLVARRAGAPVPTTAVGAAGAGTTAALVAPEATAAAIESVPTAGWVAGGVATMGVALQRAGVDVLGALSNLPVIGDRL